MIDLLIPCLIGAIIAIVVIAIARALELGVRRIRRRPHAPATSEVEGDPIMDVGAGPDALRATGRRILRPIANDEGTPVRRPAVMRARRAETADPHALGQRRGPWGLPVPPPPILATARPDGPGCVRCASSRARGGAYCRSCGARLTEADVRPDPVSERT
jgi:hypothetical protein